jgi:hypothetical protein
MRNTLQASVSAFAFAGATALTFALASPAVAAGGNIVLTGHDDDFHRDSAALQAISAATAFVRNGSSLPVLSIDQGGELQAALTSDGIPFVNVKPGLVTGGMFDHSVYSAFIVASVTTCGGCDNPVGTGALLAGFEPQIASFFNAGGGIFGLTAANDATGFSYVPEATSGSPIFDSSGFVLTPDAAGIPGFVAVNGDQTHNTFSGFGSFYKVAETRPASAGNPAVTIFGSGGTIACTGTKCTIHGGIPEPSTWALLGLGFFSLGVAIRRRRPAPAAA